MKKLLTMILSVVLCLQLTACAMPAAANTYQERSEGFINAAMESSFLGKYDNYAEYSSEDAGRSLYQSEMEYYAAIIMYIAQVEEDYLDQDTLDGYVEVAKTVLQNIKWEIQEITVDRQTGLGQVEIDLYPTDFFDLLADSSEYDAVLQEYNDTYQQTLAAEGTISDEREAEMETWFGEHVLEVCEQYASQAKVVDTPVNKLYKIDYNANDGIISDDDWDEVDDIIMDFN
ncbi:MAG: hypothetical protein NC417_01580 [Candidatus Gastranaerophilales bacterium]|nr:hypothetical protein [Candidatus Gastranaerophilales bacterium]